MDTLSSTSPIFVSGATGYLASHVIKLLLEKGHKVRGSVRSLSNTAKYNYLYDLVPSSKSNLSLVEADLTDAKAWISALQGCEYVIHIASPIPPYVPKDENEIIKPAVEGTINVLNAALVNKCKKVVVTSSSLAIVIGNAGKVCTEEDWSDITKTTHYPKSKILAEKAAWEFYEKHKNDIEMTVVNPSLIIGPGLSVHNNSSEKLFAEIIGGSFPAIPDFPIGYKVVDVRDVAVGEINALFKEGTNGKRYILTSEGNLFFTDIINILKEEFSKYGYNLPSKTLSKEEIIQYGNQIAIRTVALGPVVMQVSNFKQGVQGDSYYLFTTIINSIKKEIQLKGIEYLSQEISMSETWNSFYNKNSKNYIHYLFFGSSVCKMTCGCSAVKESTENFNSLNISIPEEWGKEKLIKIDDILNLEFGNSINYAQCRKCARKNTEFETQKYICRLPKILILRLERGNNVIINLKEFEFFNLKKYAQDIDENNTKFELYAVIIYVGNHYYSIIKDESTRKWMVCDDEFIGELESEEMSFKTNYLFFYNNIKVKNK